MRAEQARVTQEVDLVALVADVPYGDPRVDDPDIASLCQRIGVDPVPWGAYRVNRTSVPTLVWQGLLDLRISPEGSQDLVQRLGSRAQYPVFPTYGHQILDHGVCSTQTLTAFVNDPDAPIDASRVTPGPRTIGFGRGGRAGRLAHCWSSWRWHWRVDAPTRILGCVCYNLTFDSEEDLAAIAAGIAGGSANAPAAEPTTPAPPA